MTVTGLPETDPLSPAIAHRASGLLAQFNLAGVLASSDVHVASRLARLAGVEDEAVVLATALAVRAPRLGHVCVDLASIRDTASSDLDTLVEVRSLPWPATDEWLAGLATSALVGGARPLRLEGTTIYLDRYWAFEIQVAADLLARASSDPAPIDESDLAARITDLFGPQPAGGDAPDLQRVAAAAAVMRRLAVVAGGPGTGKTTIIGRVLALLDMQEEAGGRRPPVIGLAAPTGKAAVTLEEAVHRQARELPLPSATRERLLSLSGLTLHRLLGWAPGSRSRFRHDRTNRLPHDVIVVDETSMVALSLMARLLEAVRSDARLILVGDPEQLASVEAGAVLGDIVGPSAYAPRMRPTTVRALERVTGESFPAADTGEQREIGDGIIVLRANYRNNAGISRLAAGIRDGDPDDVVSILAEGAEGVRWCRPEDGTGIPSPGAKALRPVRAAAVEAGRRVIEAARDGEPGAALTALSAFRLLCAHRHGPAGAATWMRHVEGWLAGGVEGFSVEGSWYAGRPLLMTANDYSLRLFNGDVGVVVTGASGRLVAAFERGGEVVEVSTTRLASVETVYAMTVHKAQGSQFARVAVVLPEPDSPILTRELLYTAVTRAQEEVLVIGGEDAIRKAVTSPIARSSGLGRRLWGPAQ